MIYNTLSYSQIDSFNQCPQKWTFRYIDKIKVDNPSLPLEFGTAIHETLEELLIQLKFGDKIDMGTAIVLYDKKTQPLYETFEQEEVHKKIKQGQTAIINLVNQKNFYERLNGAKILGIEEPFLLSLPTKMRGEEIDIKIKGFIDLIFQKDDKIFVVDHKSSKKAFDKSKRMNNLQLPIYFMAVKELYDVEPYSGIYNFTQIDKEQEILYTPKRTQTMKDEMAKRGAKTIWAKTEQETKKEIIETARKMNNEKERVKTNPSFLCHWCDYKAICKNASNFKPKGE